MKNIQFNSVGKYMCRYAKTKIPHTGKFDDKGIPLFNTATLNLSFGYIHHPTLVIQYALAHYDLFLESGSEGKGANHFREFSRCAEWLIKNIQNDTGKLIGWYIPFGIRTPKIKGAWLSAMTQGQGISVLLRFYNHFPSDELQKLIRTLAGTFLIPCEQGGFTSFLKDGSSFPQEAGEVFILNGGLSAMEGIREFLLVFDDQKVLKIYNGSLQFLEARIKDYDIGWWSKYSLGTRFNLSDFHYHERHIEQLEHFTKITKSRNIEDVLQRWKRYSQSKLNKGALFCLNFCFVNINRTLTILGIDSFKYIKVQ